MPKHNKLKFDVDFKTRLEHQRNARNMVRLPRMGYAPYCVYEIKKSKKHLNCYSSGTGGKSSFAVFKSRQTGKTHWQQIIYDYIELFDSLSQQYEVRWLKPKQATMLRLKGHRVEPTTADDKSTAGPVQLGA